MDSKAPYLTSKAAKDWYRTVARGGLHPKHPKYYHGCCHSFTTRCHMELIEEHETSAHFKTYFSLTEDPKEQEEQVRAFWESKCVSHGGFPQKNQPHTDKEAEKLVQEERRAVSKQQQLATWYRMKANQDFDELMGLIESEPDSREECAADDRLGQTISMVNSMNEQLRKMEDDLTTVKVITLFTERKMQEIATWMGYCERMQTVNEMKIRWLENELAKLQNSNVEKKKADVYLGKRGEAGWEAGTELQAPKKPTKKAE